MYKPIHLSSAWSNLVNCEHITAQYQLTDEANVYLFSTLGLHICNNRNESQQIPTSILVIAALISLQLRRVSKTNMDSGEGASERNGLRGTLQFADCHV